MRDLKPGDMIGPDRNYIIDENGSFIPLCWDNPKHWARWCIRQAELSEHISIPKQQRKLFMAILNADD